MIALSRGLAIVGFVLAVGAVMMEDSRVTWAAIGLLFTAFLLRVVGRRRGM
jgi:hypothetical protein